MPANPRNHPPGVPLHVIQRGHNRERCFFDGADYREYLYWLGSALARFDVDLHAYVLMTNHVHLLLTPSNADAVSAAVMSYSRRYVQYMNRKYGRTGTLWDGRYKSSTIEDDAYLFACYRYIELNPVRACIVGDPADYNWSSYRFNALGEPNPMLTPRAEYLALARTASDRHQAYRELVADAMQDDAFAAIRRAVAHGRPLRRDDPVPSAASHAS